MSFKRARPDLYIREAKMYSVEDALQYGLEIAIILATGERNPKLDSEKMPYYFPEIADLDKHLKKMRELGLIE